MKYIKFLLIVREGLLADQLRVSENGGVVTERGTVTERRGEGEVVGGVNDTATRVENLVGGV